MYPSKTSAWRPPRRGVFTSELGLILAECGGVLLQDGRTIKRMTADEFNAASKAVGR
jgi:hypothetical protein